MTARELQAKYLGVFGEPTRQHRKQYLIGRIIWRMQANDEGDLSERARQRAAELANDADLRIRRPPDRPEPPGGSTTRPAPITFSDGAGLPMPGTAAPPHPEIIPRIVNRSGTGNAGVRPITDRV
jgi:hypothetical protein